MVTDHCECVLVMSRRPAVFCATCPAVALNHDVAAAHIDHRFDADTHTVTYHRTYTAPPVVGHFGRFVHAASDTMAAHFANDRVTAVFTICLDGICNITYTVTGAASLDADVE